jgi:hypothetical protein
LNSGAKVEPDEAEEMYQEYKTEMPFDLLGAIALEGAPFWLKGKA